MKSFENFDAQRPEKPDYERKSVLSWLAKVNPALIPAAFAAAMSTGEVNAESIEEIHGQDWLQGVETLRDSVMNDETEVGATFVVGEDGKQFWYSSGRGESVSVNKSTADLTRELDQFTEASGEEVERFCEAHTHNLAAMAEVDFISNEELNQFQAEGYGPSAPPSLGDINIFSEAKIRNAVGETSYFKTVFDAQGVWYSRVPTDADYDAFPNFRAEVDHKREVMGEVFGDIGNEFAGGIITTALEAMDIETLERLVVKYGAERDQKSIAWTTEHFPEDVRTSLESVLRMQLMTNDDGVNPLISEILSSDTDRNSYQAFLDADPVDGYQFYKDTKKSWIDASKDGEIDESLIPQMYEAFIRNGALVRFVPYDQVLNEPPCAGPDYRSEN